MPDTDPGTRTERAVAAAADAARGLGVTVTEPTVLYELFSVVVHLRPAPVVARVPVVLPPVPYARTDLLARQRAELDVVGWLRERGFPVTPPSPLTPAEPVLRDGFSMTFWQYVEEDEGGEPDHAADAARTAELHAALLDYPRQLSFLSAVAPTVPEVRDLLACRSDLLDPDDLDRAEREWAVLAPVLDSPTGFRAAFPGVRVQPIHGDAPMHNLLATADGALFGDFELVTSGPAEWDLALTDADTVRAYSDAAERIGLARLDHRVLRVMGTARMLQLVACLSMAPQLPQLADGLRPVLDAWRARPFADGMTD